VEVVPGVPSPQRPSRHVVAKIGEGGRRRHYTRTATALGYAAGVFGRNGFEQAATVLAHAADTLPNRDRIQSLIGAAEAISNAARDIRRYSGKW